MAKSYEEIAKEVIEAIGGKENISSVCTLCNKT